MAHAPSANSAVTEEQATPSSQGFSKLVERGRSFSGRERHCCFLNIGDSPLARRRFANVSAASGLDLIDDGRGVALVDWDHDGDLDVWISNRNAPRLRLLRNDIPAVNHFLQLRLLGSGRDTNRDAIGARVEVTVVDPENAEVRNRFIQTLRAGEGFLSQSSSWLHFGLSGADQIKRVLVQWPTSTGSVRSEEFTGLQVDRRYELVQGTGNPHDVLGRQKELAIRPASPRPAPPTDNARIPLDVRLPLPDHLIYRDLDGQQQVARTTGDMRLLINFWASNCTPCVRELSELTQRAEELKQAGISVLALLVNIVETDIDSQLSEAQRLIQRIGFPFAVGQADTAHVSLFQNYHDFAISQNRLLPIPSSFLFDEKGQVSVIYKGPVSADQLIEDIKLESSTALGQLAQQHALLPGSVIDHEVTRRAASARLASSRSTLAKALLKMRGSTGLAQWGSLAVDQFATVAKILSDEGDAHNDYGWALAQVGKLKEARSRLKKAIEIDPTNWLYHANLGYVLENLGDAESAFRSFQSALHLDENNAQVNYLLGNNRYGQKEYDEALVYFFRTIELQADHAAAEQRLGVIYALRGENDTAIQHYRRACKLSPEFAVAHHQLGVVLASMGEFTYAVEHLGRAVTLDPRNEQAKQQLRMAREMMEKGSREQSGVVE